jgi:hypothetical protein
MRPERHPCRSLLGHRLGASVVLGWALALCFALESSAGRAEVCRGERFDAAVNRPLNDKGIGVCKLTRELSQRAGGLLAKVGLASEHTIDAFVVATALSFERAVIATGDPKDIKRLVGSARKVKVFAL